MLYHATITNFKKDAQSPFSIFRRIFTLPVPRADVATQHPRNRFYSTRPPPKPCTVTWKHRNSQRTAEQIRGQPASRDCKKGTAETSPSNPEKALKDRPDPALRSMVIPTSYARAPIALTTKWELHEEILRLSSLTPPAPFSRLLSLHQRHPVLQSAESYNLLLHLSIRHSFSRRTRHLFDSMALNHVEPNLTTEKLVVRFMVINGKWKEAWRQVMKRYHSIPDTPLLVLLELLAPGTRNFPRMKLIPIPRPHRAGFGPRPHSQRRLDAPLEIVEDGGPPVKIPLDTLILILHRFSQLSLDEVARLPPRIISYAVRGLIRNGHHEPALVLTESHLKSLPPVIGPARIDFARDLVHLHLSWGDIKLANYKKKRRLVERLFSLHPSLHPNAQTVFLLMRYLERSKRCGIEAYLFFKDYRVRWGATVESLEVRRRVVAYAIKQRKYGIAKEMSMECSPDDSAQPPRQGTYPVASLRMRAWRTMYPRKGREAQLWRRLTIRMLGKRREVPKLPWPARAPSSRVPQRDIHRHSSG